MGIVSDTYAAVDESDDPAGAARWQQRMATWPAVRAYKEHTYRLIGDREPILDLGCGPGVDLVPLGVGRTIGLDPSGAMCLRAAGTGAVVCRGSAEHPPFRDASLGACRVDRVLQHLADPERAIREMVRITRPGGIVVAAEPDQESLVITVPGVPRTLCDQLKGLRRDVGYRNGRLASRLPELFSRHGLDEVNIEAFPLVLDDPADAFGLPDWPRLWQQSGLASFSTSELELWDHEMHAGSAGGLVYALMFFVVSGVRP